MSSSAALRCSTSSSPFSQCTSCSLLRVQPFIAAATFDFPQRFRRCRLQFHRLSSASLRNRRNVGLVCRVSESENQPEDNDDGNKHESGESTSDTDSAAHNDSQLKQHESGERTSDSDTTAHNDSQIKQESEQDSIEALNTIIANNNETQANGQAGTQDADNPEVTSGSPLPGLKLPQLDDFVRIPKETVDILKDQVFGFDTFFVTAQEPYEGGVLFKGNLRGIASKSYEKISKRLQDKFGDEYKLFMLINPEDDKPVAVVVPRKTLQPETTAVPEWLAAGAFGLVTVFTLLLRNVPALQANLLSSFDNLELLKDGLPGALVTAAILGVHELGHYIVAKDCDVKLGVPYFVPSWQIGSFGAITRIVNIVPRREDLLKIAAAGPLAGYGLGLILFLVGFIVPPSDGLGIVVNASVFHESLLVGGIAKLLLGDVLKDGQSISLNPLVIWAWAGLLINAINSIPAGELDGGRISLAIWGRKASARLTGASIVLLGLSSLFSDVAFYWVVLIFFLQRGPIAPLSEEISEPDQNYVALGIGVLLLGLLVCLPYPFAFTTEATMSF